MSGDGVLNYEDGTIFTGAFKRDMRDGKGKVKQPNGQEYEGEWKRNQLTGSVTYIQNGQTEEGVFRKGKRVDNRDCWLERYDEVSINEDSNFDVPNTPPTAWDMQPPVIEVKDDLPPLVVRQMLQKFKEMDFDGDGTVSVDEMTNFLNDMDKKLKITKATVGKIVR